MSLNRLLVAKRNGYGYGAGFLLILMLLYPELVSAGPTHCQNPSVKGPAADMTRALEPSSSVWRWPESVSALPADLASIWIMTAAALSPEGHHPFSEVAPLSRLMQKRLKGDLKARIREWSSVCMIPGRRKLFERHTEFVYTDLIPLPGTRLHTVMIGMTRWLDGSQQNCGTTIDRLLSQIQLDLVNLVGSNGEPLVKRWSSELGVTPDEVAAFLLLRALSRPEEPER